MNPIDIHILQNLGTIIFHSLWQIGLITFLYFLFVLTRKKISVNCKYTLGLSSFVIILISFIFTFYLVDNYRSPELLTPPKYITQNIVGESQQKNFPEKEVVETQNNDNLLPLNYTKIRLVFNQLTGVIGLIWLLGLIFFIIRKIHAYYTLKSIKHNKHNVRSIKWEKTLREISIKLNLKKKVDILFSPFISSPLSFGFIKPVILFPLRITTGLSTEEIKCILIHELAHNLRNDYLYNLFQHVIETLFFYHPGIWWISKNIRTQREIICDKIVLDNKISEKQYAHTLLKLSELQLSDSNLAIAANRNSKELFTRIKHILNKPDSIRLRKINPFMILGIIMVLVVSGFVLEGNEGKLETTVLEKEIEKILDPFNGSFVVYDFQNDEYFTSNDSICNMRYPAYSTFKIANSLIAFDMGVAKNASYTIKYDSIKYPLPKWMKEDKFFKNWYIDHTIKTAMEYSVNWYFSELIEQVGHTNMMKYLNKLNYGSEINAPGNNLFWYMSQLKISGIEQVEFIKDILNQNCEGISKDAQSITKQIFPVKTERTYSLYGKTGKGQIADERYIGWYVGFLETGNNTYAYALNVFTDDWDEIPGDKRQELAQDIFTKLGLID